MPLRVGISAAVGEDVWGAEGLLVGKAVRLVVGRTVGVAVLEPVGELVGSSGGK